MRKHDWPKLIQAQAMSGETITAFCRSHKVSKSTFYGERKKHPLGNGVLPIAVQEREIRIAVQLGNVMVLGGSAADLAEVLRCL